MQLDVTARGCELDLVGVMQDDDVGEDSAPSTPIRATQPLFIGSLAIDKEPSALHFQHHLLLLLISSLL